MNPDTDCPLELRKMILRYAGENPYGKPMWRVCLAQHVLVKRGGVFHDLEGVRTMLVQGPSSKIRDERGRQRIVPGKMYYKKIGDRVTSAYCVEVPKYPHKGWIMERWQPPHIYGTERDWEAQKSEDGTPMMGPFPKQGGYWMINGPFPKRPDWGDLSNAIAQYECVARHRPMDLNAALRQQMKEEEEDRERRRQAYEDELEKLRISELLPVLKSGSLSAQRFRQSLNQLIGDRSHFAAL